MILKVSQYDFSPKEFDNIEVNTIFPVKKIIICTTPRTAGHALANHMRIAGWGVPAEYFHPVMATAIDGRWTKKTASNFTEIMNSAQSYGDNLLKHRVKNGIFSAKVFPYDFYYLKRSIGNENARYIYLERSDRASQLVSLVALYSTGRPFDSDLELSISKKTQVINEAVISKIYKILLAQIRYWEVFFEKIAPSDWIRIKMEDFVANPSYYVKQISRQFNIPISSVYFEVDFLERRYSQDKEIKDEIFQKFGYFINSLILG